MDYGKLVLHIILQLDHAGLDHIWRQPKVCAIIVQLLLQTVQTALKLEEFLNALIVLQVISSIQLLVLAAHLIVILVQIKIPALIALINIM